MFVLTFNINKFVFLFRCEQYELIALCVDVLKQKEKDAVWLKIKF